jgi:hypothetical protein
VEALNGDADSFSFEASNYYFNYIGEGVVSECGGPAGVIGAASPLLRPVDSLSWRVVPALDGSAFWSLQSAASPELYLTVTHASNSPCSWNSNQWDLTLAQVGADGATRANQTFHFMQVDHPVASDAAPWQTDHHDAQNSGFSAWDGPGEAAAVCPEDVIRDDPLGGSGTTRFFAAGVTSAADGWLFAGDSDDTLHMLEDVPLSQRVEGGDKWRELAFNLADAVGVGDDTASDCGVVGAPAAASDYGASTNGVFVASGDGYLYAVNALMCFSQARYPGGSAARAAAEAAGAVSSARARRRRLSGGGGGGAAPRRANFSLSPPEAQWFVYSKINAVYAAEIHNYPFATYGVTDSWEECQAACIANNTAGGGEPTSCVVWTWHDPFTEPRYAKLCVFKYTAGFPARAQGDHVSGFLSAPTAGDQCVTWYVSVTDPDLEVPLQPSYSPPRIVTYEAPVGSGVWQTAVLASETDPTQNQGGILHAFDAADGTRLWTYLTGGDMGDGLMGVVPAQHPLFPELLFLAHGAVVVAINASACPVGGGFADPCLPAFTFDSTSVPGSDGQFVSSVALLPDGSGLFVHSASGALWRLDVGVAPLSITFSWACTYRNPALCTPLAESTQRYVSGGFYRPTTASQREELWDAVSAAHSARFGEAAGAAAPGESAARRATRLSRELPPEVLFGLTTPSGYSAGRGAGARGFCPAIDTAQYPFATPALFFSYLNPNDPSTVRDFRVAVVNWDASADSALVVVNASRGDPLFGVPSVALGNGKVYAFGKSRSSPAFDRQGHVYAATDLDYDGTQGDDTLPAVIAYD